MRIVYIYQYFSTTSVAGSTRAYEFARRLVERGHSVNMITTCPVREGPTAQRPGSWSVTEEAGITVHWCAVDYSNNMPYSARIRAFLEFAVRAVSRVRSLERDVVFATSTPLTVAIPAVLGARRAAPLVFEIRDLWPDAPIVLGVLRNPALKRVAYALEAWAYRSAEHVVALAPEMAASVERRFPAVPVSVIPNSSDIELFSVDEAVGKDFRERRPWLGNGPLVVYAGTFGKVNNLSYVVRMAAAMRPVDPDVRFLLVGDGREEAELKDLARRLDVLDRNLFFEPAMAKRDVPALLSAADLCLSTVLDIPQLAGSSANKAFDAFAAGRPLAVNHGGSLADTLLSSGAGLVMPPADPGVAARDIADRLRDATWTAGARAAAGALARDRFDRGLLFEKLEEILVSVT